MLAIITVVHNRAEITSRFTKLLAQQSYQNFHLILVDDGSIDDTQEECKKNLPSSKLTVLKGSGKLFWGGGLQTAYLYLLNQRQFAFEHVLICNDDIVIDHSYLDVIINEFRMLPPKTLLHSRQVLDESKEIIRGFKISWSARGMNVETNADLINVLDTRSLVLSKEDFLESGGFRPFLLRHYRSDWEFTYRMYKKGFTLMAASDSIVHVPNNLVGKPGRASIESFKDFVSVNWNIRNPSNIRCELSFVLLVAPLWLKPVLIARTLWGFSKGLVRYSILN